MPVKTWTMPLYVTAFRDALRARPGLVGVQIMSAPIDKAIIELEAITVVDVDAEEEERTMGNPTQGRDETYFLEGVLQVLASGEGEDAAVEARDRAAAIFAEVETEIRENPDMGLNATQGGHYIRRAGITRKRLRQGASSHSKLRATPRRS